MENHRLEKVFLYITTGPPENYMPLQPLTEKKI